MVSNKLIAAAFANLALLASVNAGPFVVSDTSSALSTTIETSTAITEIRTASETEVITKDATTTSALVSETSTTIAVSESTTVVSSSDTTIVTSSEATTVPTTTDGTATVAESATTTTTAEAEPIELLINGNFDLGTVNPWLSGNGPVQVGSSSPYEGPAYTLLQFRIDNGESVNNRVYQKIGPPVVRPRQLEQRIAENAQVERWVLRCVEIDGSSKTALTV
ncbi:hypothetical protein HG530_014578 [Fusarium avenaceum]|nr:hypothetical protein HG530_014578 [Fusarium avenaceum]